MKSALGLLGLVLTLLLIGALAKTALRSAPRPAPATAPLPPIPCGSKSGKCSNSPLPGSPRKFSSNSNTNSTPPPAPARPKPNKPAPARPLPGPCPAPARASQAARFVTRRPPRCCVFCSCQRNIHGPCGYWKGFGCGYKSARLALFWGYVCQFVCIWQQNFAYQMGKSPAAPVNAAKGAIKSGKICG